MRVKCIDNDDVESALKIGDVYNVISWWNDSFIVRFNNGVEYGFSNTRFEPVKEDTHMSKIKIEKWEDLDGLVGEDKWGNKFKICHAHPTTIDIDMYTEDVDDIIATKEVYVGTQYLKGGRERILGELKMCGFDVEFIGIPELTTRQKLELMYFKEVHNAKWIIKDGQKDVWVYGHKPNKSHKTNAGELWFVRGDEYKLQLNYDFIEFEDDEPWSIEELLKVGK